jgi:hypothetical protein
MKGNKLVQNAGYLCIFIFLFLSSSAEAAVVKIEPQTRILSVFSTTNFTVNISITDATNLYGFQFDLTYDPNILELVSFSEGNFLNRSGQDRTFCVAPNTTTQGLIDNFACSRIGSGSVSGNGVLANITFKLKVIANLPTTSSLVLSDVKLSDINSQPISATTQNGQVTIYECLSGETRSCQIFSCQGTKTCGTDNKWGSCVVNAQQEICDGIDNDCDGYTDNAQGVQQNYTLTRPCSLTHYGICSIGTERCQLVGGTPKYAGCPSPQEEICDNGIDESCDNTDPLCAGDADGNRCVNILDLSLVALHFGKTSNFDQRADRNNDGKVDIFDLVRVGKDFGLGSAC